MGLKQSDLMPGRAGRSVLLAGALLAGVWAGQLTAAPAAQPGRLGQVRIDVVDGNGGAVDQAIVWALPLSGQAVPALGQATARIEQRAKTFIPKVTPVRVGTAVDFPNLDTVRHHVYSFSAAKIFSLKLYIGTPAAPVVFDKPGEIVLGCNIHDSMLGYVLALDTPFFGTTEADGRVHFVDLPPGDYEVRAWHPRQNAGPAAERITVRDGGTLAHRIVADVPLQRPAAAGG